MFNCYLEECKVEPKVDIHTFCQVVEVLCMMTHRDVNELIETVLEHYNSKIQVMKVYSKDNKLIDII